MEDEQRVKKARLAEMGLARKVVRTQAATERGDGYGVVKWLPPDDLEMEVVEPSPLADAKVAYATLAFPCDDLGRPL